MAEIPRGGGSTVRLISVYGCKDAPALLYELLAQRKPSESISHKAMPTMEEHIRFIESRPYGAWYLAEAVTDLVDDVALVTENVGAVYITRAGEIGVGILDRFKGFGYAKSAITELMRLHPGRHLANINPANEASIALFRSLGFGGPIQITLEKA